MPTTLWKKFVSLREAAPLSKLVVTLLVERRTERKVDRAPQCSGTHRKDTNEKREKKTTAPINIVVANIGGRVSTLLVPLQLGWCSPVSDYVSQGSPKWHNCFHRAVYFWGQVLAHSSQITSLRRLCYLSEWHGLLMNNFAMHLPVFKKLGCPRSRND